MVIYEAADLSILALGILADDDHVDVAAFAVRQRRSDSFIEDGGTDIGVLVESAPDGQQQSVERDVIGDIGVAHGAQVDGVGRAQQFQRVLRHHPAVREIVFRAPVEILEAAGEVVLSPGAVEDPLAFRNHFLADTVAGDHCDM